MYSQEQTQSGLFLYFDSEFFDGAGHLFISGALHPV